VREEEVEG
jgi:hypothetical protein